ATDDGYALAGVQLQLQTAEHAYRLRALLVALAQVTAAEYRSAQRRLLIHNLLTHNVAPPPAGYGPRARPGKGWRESSGPTPRRKPGSHRQPSAATAGSQ